MPTVLITGSSRGLGLEFACQFQKLGWEVIATCRYPAHASELSALAGVEVQALDVADHDSVVALKETMGQRPIDVLLNNAGILGQLGTVSQIDHRSWHNAMNTNVFGPFRVVQALAANVAASNRKQMVFISSSAGSIAAAQPNNSVYRSSKAALNMAARCLSLEVAEHGLTVNLLCPGSVSTDMTSQGGRHSPRDSVAGMIRQILSFTSSDNGRFVTHEGNNVPW